MSSRACGFDFRTAANARMALSTRFCGASRAIITARFRSRPPGAWAGGAVSTGCGMTANRVGRPNRRTTSASCFPVSQTTASNSGNVANQDCHCGSISESHRYGGRVWALCTV